MYHPSTVWSTFRPVRPASAGHGRWRPRHVARLLAVWRERWQGRRQLAALQDWQLRDIGVDRIDALREARKPFWRA